MYQRTEVKRYAAQLFSKRYWPLVGTCLLLTGLGSIGNASFESVREASFSTAINLGFFLLWPPTTVGLAMYCLKYWRQESASIEQAFTDGFSDYGRTLGGMLLTALYTVLWSMLLIVPGIIKNLSYSMTPYILGDCRQVSATDAIKLSKRMMQGHKMELFTLHLSFIGWYLLSILTAGILLIFYVEPYHNMTIAGYYALRKEQALADGTITKEELEGAPIY